MRYEAPSKDDAAKINRLLNATQAIRAQMPSMPSSYVAAFLAVALKPGQPVSEYARDIGTIQPIMSRILLEIGQKSRQRDNPLALVDSAPDPNDLRVSRYHLTAKGRTLLQQVLRNL
jgi:DNA-binding MarR family transcriptional regulator